MAALIADDLTGACDAAVHFAVAGLETSVSLDGRMPEAEVAAFSTDSRDVDESLIRSRIAEVARTLTGSFAGVLFKKIDSV
ncbi:MAG TPA: four-carbon acid sugar kinase family protein, partial [Bryobacteraceae bacterium]|nr:four-carbon acid sugar kinase family protein [Bryobacteraceae bacterium]